VGSKIVSLDKDMPLTKVDVFNKTIKLTQLTDTYITIYQDSTTHLHWGWDIHWSWPVRLSLSDALLRSLRLSP